MPEFFPPMLATLADEPFSRAGWLFEAKLDGERCMVFRREGRIQLFSRNARPLEEKYPELIAPLKAARKGSYILDGEIVAFEGAVTSFGKLQGRMQAARPPVELQRRIPVFLYVFDLLYIDGYDIRAVPLRYRKELLRAGIEFRDPLRFTEHREGEGVSFFDEARRRGWEGIVAKNGESAYVSGRSREWLKFKCVWEQEFVIGGYTDPQGAREHFGALLVGYYEGGRLRYAGKVGAGYDAATLRNLGRQLRRLETAECPFRADGLPKAGVHWVKPELVAQIGFTEWTGAGKLRHPRFLGLRQDKRPQDVVRER
ncbi:MAG TPA: non-homologous end-joining DNA ligase [Bryobacteraceae bacterium]|nr:non-homologous end-joining DNA ligase [Bryobacteraceae bacterium]